MENSLVVLWSRESTTSDYLKFNNNETIISPTVRTDLQALHIYAPHIALASYSIKQKVSTHRYIVSITLIRLVY